MNSFISKSNLPYLVYNNRPRSIRIPPSQFPSKWTKIESNTKQDFKPARFHYYWLGTKGRPYGFFNRAVQQQRPFLHQVRLYEQNTLYSGAPSPFLPLIVEPEDGECVCFIDTLSRIFNGNSNLKMYWQNIMKTLYEGVLDALIRLNMERGITDIPNIFYAHDADEISEEATSHVVRVQTGKCPQRPKEGDCLVVGRKNYRVESSGEEGGHYNIRISVL